MQRGVATGEKTITEHWSQATDLVIDTQSLISCLLSFHVWSSFIALWVMPQIAKYEYMTPEHIFLLLPTFQENPYLSFFFSPWFLALFFQNIQHSLWHYTVTILKCDLFPAPLSRTNNIIYFVITVFETITELLVLFEVKHCWDTTLSSDFCT